MVSKAAPQHRNAGMSKEAIQVSLADHLIYSSSKYHTDATTRDWFNATAITVRDRLIERWMETMRSYYAHDAKRVYYLSLEFLMGRTLMNSLLNLAIEEQCSTALYELGLEFEEIAKWSPMRRWATAGWGGWRPVFWIRWRR